MVILTDTFRDCLYFRHSSLLSLWSWVHSFLLGSKDHSPSQHRTPFFCLLIPRLLGPKVAGWLSEFPAPSNHCVSLGGSIPFPGTKTSRLEEHKVMGTGSTHFASESLAGKSEGCHSQLYPHDFWTHESSCGTKSTIYWMLILSTDNLLENLARALQHIAT